MHYTNKPQQPLAKKEGRCTQCTAPHNRNIGQKQNLLLDIWQLEAIVLLLILNLEQHADKQCHNAE